VRLRYRSPALGCRLDGDEIHLAEPFDGAAPGQTAVFLAGDAIVGCATIAA
jgi:tRNA-specific 2-thiouridylase